MKYKIFLILGSILLVGGGCKNIKTQPQGMNSALPTPAEQNNQESNAINTYVADTSENHISKKGEYFSLSGLGRILLPAGLQVQTNYNKINKTYWSGRIDMNLPEDPNGLERRGFQEEDYFIEFRYTEGNAYNEDPHEDTCEYYGYTKGVQTTFLNHSGLYCTERRGGGETVTVGYGYILNILEVPDGKLVINVYGSGRGLKDATALLKSIVWTSNKEDAPQQPLVDSPYSGLRGIISKGSRPGWNKYHNEHMRIEFEFPESYPINEAKELPELDKGMLSQVFIPGIMHISAYSHDFGAGIRDGCCYDFVGPPLDLDQPLNVVERTVRAQLPDAFEFRRGNVNSTPAIVFFNVNSYVSSWASEIFLLPYSKNGFSNLMISGTTLVDVEGGTDEQNKAQVVEQLRTKKYMEDTFVAEKEALFRDILATLHFL